MPDFPDVIHSPLSRDFSQDELTVKVQIYKLEGSEGWTLEIIDEEGGSTVWQESFDTDTAALAEFVNAAEELGLEKLIDPDDDDLATVH